MKNTRTIDHATQEPLYECTTCHTPVIPNTVGVYQKDHNIFCSAGCVYTYYEGEPAAQVEDYHP